MRWSANHFYKRLACTRSALTSRAITDALVFAVLLSAIAAALGPAISIQSPLNITYSYSAINLNYTYDTATYCKYELTNTSGGFNTSLPTCQNTTLSGVTEGANSVKVWANDSANNWNASNIVYFSVDTIKPAIRFVAPTDNTTTITRPWSYVNVTVNDSSGSTAFINWNNSLAGWWRFNGESGETGTFFRDWSTYGNNATCSNCPVSTPGRFGSALQFDGINDYLSIPDSDSLDLGSSFTIEGWFKPSRTFDGSADYYQGILDKGAYQLFLDKSDGKLKFFMDSSAPKNWSALGSGTDGWIYSLAVWNGSLYAGGYFTTAGEVSANRTAKWNGSEWSAIGSGVAYTVYSFAVWNGILYAGGMFTSAGGVSANRIARWNGTDWSQLGSGMNERVYSLAVWNGSLYAGGDFTSAGGVSANYIARWNGSSWSSLGNGMNASVTSIVVYNDELYAGGAFTTAGGGIANYIAKWNGTEWGAVGSGLNVMVWSLAVWNGSLYAGGQFTSAGGVSANRIARWNGTDWSQLGSGVDSAVYSLVVYNGALYVGGLFTSAGGVSANYIARWNGSSWSALGPSVNSYVFSLAVFDGMLYAGGDFTSAGGVSANRIAKWSSGEERAVGSSTNSWPADWQHFAVSYDNSSLKLYRNGVLEGSVSANISVAANSLPLLLGTTYGSRQGGSSSSGPEQFEGAIDEVRIHRRALSAEEINASFSSGAYRLYRNFTNMADGIYPFSAYAQDSAGNVNQTETRVLVLDTSPPAWVQVPANQTTAYNASFAYDINATDLSGVDRYWIDDNANFTINPSSGLVTNNTFLGIGLYPLNVSVNDTWGYATSILFTVNVRDTSMPALAVYSPQFANYTTANPNLSITTSENASITYNWDGTGNISGCLNCTSYNSTYGELVPDADTLLLLHFNENHGNISHDQTGANNGTIYGAGWTSGRFGHGLAFDGTNRNVTLPAGLDPVGAFTIEAWVNATGASNQMAIADKYEEVGAYANGYSLYLKNGAPWFGVYNSNNMWVAEWRVDSDIRNTGWHYVAGVYNGTSLRVFLDNRSELLPGTYVGGASASSASLALGNRANKTWYFNGTLDEVRFTSRALSDPELAAGRDRRLSDGAHSITVYATDSDGNANYTAVSFNTDATPPFCTFLTANKTYFRNGTPLNFTAFCNDTSTFVSSVYLNATAIGRGIVQMSPIGGGYYASALTVNNNRSESLNVGIHNVTDAYGGVNHSNPILLLTVDNTNPAVLLDLSLNQSWQKGAMLLAYNASDTQSVSSCLWRWRNSTGIWSTYTGIPCGTGLAFLFDTTNCYDSSAYGCNIEMFANDSAGNSNSSEMYFRIDNSPPNISQVLPANNSVLYSNITRISFNITDPFFGVNLSRLIINPGSGYEYNATNISCSAITNGFNCSLVIAQTDGIHSIKIEASDNLSNSALAIIDYTVAGCQPPAGDWAINYTQSCANKTIVLNGNLTVYPSGNLTFRNATLLMNGTYDGARGIEVQGGAFYVLDNDGVQSTPDGSNITSLGSSSRFLFVIGANSTFEMRNSELSYGGYAGGGIAGAWYDGGGSFNIGEGAVILAANARLTGSKISNSFNGIAGILENATFENNTITSNSGDGMRLLANNSLLRGNRLAANGQNGLFLLGSQLNLVSNNNISSNGAGIRMRYSSNNTVLGNTLYSNSGSGILLEADSKNNSLRLNAISYNGGSGAYLQQSGYNELANNTISSNSDGITVYGSAGERIAGNTLSGNNPYGIRLLYSNSSTISNNTISATVWDGLRLQYAHANNFSGNKVSGSGEAGVYLISSANNFFSREDSFYGDLYGLYFDGASGNTFASSAVSSGSGVLRYDLYSKGNSTNTLLNSSYSSPKTYFENGSNILRQWYLLLTAVNASSLPLSNASITVIDNRSSVAFSGATGSDGTALIPLTESIVSTDTTAYTPHRILANASGFFGNASMTMNESKNLTLALYDITPPQLLGYWFEPQYMHPNSTTVFRAYLWENSGISSAWLRIATPNGTYNLTLAFQSENSTGQTWAAQVTSTGWSGQYNLTYLFLNDTNGNNDTPSISAYFRVQSDLPPNVTYSETSAPNAEVNSSITISANITDDYNITAAYLSVLSPAISQGSMVPVSGNRTFGLWRINYTPAQRGTYYYRILANDNSSNTAYSATYSFNSTPYNCTSASRISTYESCMAVGCLWSVGAFPLCSFYNSSTGSDTFDLALNSDNTFIALTNKDRIGRLTSATSRNAVVNISINGIMVSLPLYIAANSPREIGVLTYGLALSPFNSSIASAAYSNYRLYSTINGSGNVSATVYTSTFGAPENITLDNVIVPFSYNNASKIAEFNISLGSPHALEIRFTEPCAPSGGSCGTCCAGLSCCSGTCAPTCAAPSQQAQQSGASGAGVPVKSVAISASTANIATKIGTPASFTVTIKNTGTENLTAVALDFANISRGWFTVSPGAQNIPVGAEAYFSVTVTPPLDGQYNFSVYVPTPRSQYVQMYLSVTNAYAQAGTPGSANTDSATQGQEEGMQGLELLFNELEGNLTNAKKQGADTSSLEKILEEARLALAEGRQDKAKLLLDYVQGEVPKLKTSQANAASGIPAVFIALTLLGAIGFLAARYKDQIFPKRPEKEGGETVTFSRETEGAQKSAAMRISDLRGRIVQADLAIDGGEIQKAAEVYQAIQKEYDDLVINSVSADAQTQMALNEIYASIERIYERLSKNG